METYYTNDHEWITVEGETGTIGITGYAAGQLGDITFVGLPQVGNTVKQSEVMCEIESVKAASDIYAPLSGSIMEVNEILATSPEILNSSPESDGWITKIRISNLQEKNILMNKNQYDEYLKTLEH